MASLTEYEISQQFARRSSWDGPLQHPLHKVWLCRLSHHCNEAALHVSRPDLSSLLNCKADLSGVMALRIEKAFGVRMDTLMRMQASYDIAQTRKREKQIHVRRINQLVRA
jgi:addiction module HigA family antidote